MGEVTDMPVPEVFQTKLQVWTPFSPVSGKNMLWEFFELDDHSGSFLLQNTYIYEKKEMDLNIPRDPKLLKKLSHLQNEKYWNNYMKICPWRNA